MLLLVAMLFETSLFSLNRKPAYLKKAFNRGFLK